MRDNALAKELIRQGHDAVMLPMYLPLTLDEAPVSTDAPVFYGGINVYLQQKFAVFRKAPRWIDRLFNHRALLKLAGKQSGMTNGAELGELTHSMLLGEHGRQAKELEKLIEWLLRYGKPDAIWISTALLVGLARRIKEALSVPVLASLQGEDVFLDSLPEPWRTRCWDAMAERSRDAGLCIAPSAFYGELMGGRLHLSREKLRVIPNGVALEATESVAGASAGSNPPVIGFLARLIKAKGLGLLVDAFILLKRRGKFPSTRLRCAGAMIAEDERYVASLKEQIADAGFAADAEFLPNVSREEKQAFLASLTLLSVPVAYGEAFGLYVIEAMAAGVPVVQPRTAAFPEIIQATGGGVLCEPGSAAALAEAWETVLAEPERAREMGRRGREAVEREFSIARMAQRFVATTREIMDEGRAAH